MTEERRIDETISRTASVLHLFGSILVNSSIWTEQCLFSLVKLISLKKIGMSYEFNMCILTIINHVLFVLENVNTVLNLINNFYFNNEETNIIEKYLDYIMDRWLSEGLLIHHFPFEMFNCTDKHEFYSKYLDTCFLRLISNDKQDLIDVANHLGISETDILTVS